MAVQCTKYRIWSLFDFDVQIKTTFSFHDTFATYSWYSTISLYWRREKDSELNFANLCTIQTWNHHLFGPIRLNNSSVRVKTMEKCRKIKTSLHLTSCLNEVSFQCVQIFFFLFYYFCYCWKKRQREKKTPFPTCFFKNNWINNCGFPIK